MATLRRLALQGRLIPAMPLHCRRRTRRSHVARRPANRATYRTGLRTRRDGNVFMCEYQPRCRAAVDRGRRKTRSSTARQRRRSLSRRRAKERAVTECRSTTRAVRHVRARMARRHARRTLYVDLYLYGSKQVHTGDICSFFIPPRKK
jgi:hypothetical protein